MPGMFSRLFGRQEEKKSDFEIVSDDEEESSDFVESLKVNLTRLIAYAQSADVVLQREVAERLANEAVKPDRQVQIVECDGLRLLVPLVKSEDTDVRRLAAHALANLSVNQQNQILMAKEGAIEMLIGLLSTPHALAQRQSAKALANLGVNADNKRNIVLAGAIPPLVELMFSENVSVRIEAVAAVANLAVLSANATDIVAGGGLEPVVDGARLAMSELLDVNDVYEVDENMEELAAQCGRALRNLSANPENRPLIRDLGGVLELRRMLTYPNDRIVSQARRAMKNMEPKKSSRK